MAARRVNPTVSSQEVMPPATTLEGREKQLMLLAVDLAEQQIRDGTVSAQVLTHYVKMSSTREQLEQQKASHEVELLRVKAEAMESQKKMESVYEQALLAMRRYTGQDVPPADEEEFR